MLVFLDTEFTNLLEFELISIGFISADGQHEFYDERTDFNRGACSDFVQAEVLPHLEFQQVQCDILQLSQRLEKWFKTLPNATVAIDNLVDLKLLQLLLGGKLPANITHFYDMESLIQKPSFNKAASEYHRVPGQPWHHALHDARALRLGWFAWDRQSGNFGMRRYSLINELIF